jgi:hypothetical protein
VLNNPTFASRKCLQQRKSNSFPSYKRAYRQQAAQSKVPTPICCGPRLSLCKEKAVCSGLENNTSEKFPDIRARLPHGLRFEFEFVTYENSASAVKLPLKSADNKAGLHRTGMRRCTSRSSLTVYWQLSMDSQLCFLVKLQRFCKKEVGQTGPFAFS